MYVREVDSRQLTFQVSGKLWMRSLVMMDVETGSEWAHLLGKAMAGELKGRRLKPLITDMVTWAAWKEQHPATTILNMPRTAQHYTSQFYGNPNRFVFGFEVDGEAHALPMAGMVSNPVHQFSLGEIPLLATFDERGAVTHLFESRIGERKLNFEQVDERIMTDRQTGSHWELFSGICMSGELAGQMLRQRVGIMSFRKAWQDFHPESEDVRF